jgi:alkylation response protein AidB-like acyl-CoA dehydrogenase
LHGGIGVTEEYDLHFFSRRAKERSIAWGTSDECVKIVSRSVASGVDWL